MRRELLISGLLVCIRKTFKAAALGFFLLVASIAGLAGGSDAFAMTQLGLASWYGPGFHGKKTASGETFNQFAMTAARRKFPLGSVVMVTNLDNGRRVRVEINDRGPYVDGRIIDLSKAAAQKLGMVEDGLAPVRIEVTGGDEVASK